MDAANTATMTDDQELAKVLDSMNHQKGSTPPDDLPQADDTTLAAPNDDVLEFQPPAPTLEAAPIETPVEAAAEAPYEAPIADPIAAAPVAAPAPTASPELDTIKKSALEELRPLVDKLDLPAEEKFDTLLLIIRSTDDKSLVSAAHDAARNIPDETKRAQALLDVIKEIDYFSGHGQTPA